MTTPAWIGLGSNLGDRRAILEVALGTLNEFPGVVVRRVSSYHETRSVGGPPGQGPFLNAAAELESDLDPHQLLAVLQEVEKQAGRIRSVRWGERTLDLDLLIYGNWILNRPMLRLPHPRLALRRFVLGPLAEIAPTLEDPMTRRTVADLLANLDRRPRLISIDGPMGRQKSTIFDRLVEQLPGFGISGADLGTKGDDQDNDPIVSASEEIDWKVKALKANFWAIESLRIPWIVSDDFLGLDLLRATSRNLWKDNRPSEAEARFEAHRGWKREMVELANLALPPTFVLMISGDRAVPRLPGVVKVPQLWPDSDEPDAIVAEVVATCRGIEEV